MSKRLGLVHVGDGVLQRVAREAGSARRAATGPRRRRSGYSTWISSASREPIVSESALAEGPGRHHDRIDRRAGRSAAALDRLAVLPSRCSAVRSVAMTSQSANAPAPAMWSRCQWLRTTVKLGDAPPLELRADELAAVGRGVRVVDDRRVALDDRVARESRAPGRTRPSRRRRASRLPRVRRRRRGSLRSARESARPDYPAQAADSKPLSVSTTSGRSP